MLYNKAGMAPPPIPTYLGVSAPAPNECLSIDDDANLWWADHISKEPRSYTEISDA